MNVLIDLPVFESSLNLLKSLTGINVEVIQFPEERSRVLPKELIENCEAMLCTFPPENYLEMLNLKYLQISSAGFNQVVGKGFEKRNVKVCNALGVFDIPIAEWNISMMINLSRDLRTLIRNQESQVWDRSARFQKEIRGSVVGIWGYGGIGRETARLAKALGLKVHVLERYGIEERRNSYCVPGTGDTKGIIPDKVFLMNDKEEFLKGLDFLIMAIPLTADNEGIVGEPELKMLRPGAFLLNPARGPLVREEALLKALREGWIAGAALDTHYYYPMPPEHPLWHMPNVMMTPHISGSSSSPKFLERVWDIFVQNIQEIRDKWHGNWTVRSVDGGKTWLAPSKTVVSAPHGPIQLRDGRLLYVGTGTWYNKYSIQVELGNDKYEHKIVYTNGYRHLHPADIIKLKNGDICL